MPECDAWIRSHCWQFCVHHKKCLGWLSLLASLWETHLAIAYKCNHACDSTTLPAYSHIYRANRPNCSHNTTAWYLVCFDDDWWNVAVFCRQRHDAIRECNGKTLVFIVPLDLGNWHCHVTMCKSWSFNTYQHFENSTTKSTCIYIKVNLVTFKQHLSNYSNY